MTDVIEEPPLILEDGTPWYHLDAPPFYELRYGQRYAVTRFAWAPTFVVGGVKWLSNYVEIREYVPNPHDMTRTYDGHYRVISRISEP